MTASMNPFSRKGNMRLFVNSRFVPKSTPHEIAWLKSIGWLIGASGMSIAGDNEIETTTNPGKGIPLITDKRYETFINHNMEA